VADKGKQLSMLGEAVAVVSHDAGGAEILSSYVRRQGLHPMLVLEGPAKKVFERKLGAKPTVSLAFALEQADLFLCSTSWQSDLEFEAIERCKASGKPSVAFLDHWVNYRERFTRGSRFALPDQIWVGDAVGKNKADEVFADHPVFLEENPYFLDIKEEIAALKPLARIEGLRVLYVCEPIKEHAKLRYGDERQWGYVEEDALRYFLDNVSVLDTSVAEIRIRPHPSENAAKYAWAQDEFNMPIVQGGASTLLAEIAACDVVVGCESMAMVIGLIAGKRVISSIPPGGRACALPQSEIQRLEILIHQQSGRV
jgi:hypothetical protein